MDMAFPEDRIHHVPSQANQVIVSVNPNAGSRSSKSAVTQLKKSLELRHYEVSVHDEIDKVAELANSLQESGSLRAVVAAGGDGTASLIANRTPPGTPIALLPQGTENLLAKYLGMGSEPDEISELIHRGQTVDLDAGQANGRLFLLMLGCGFDAEVVRRLDEIRSGHIHHLSYMRPILDSIFSYQYPDIRITAKSSQVAGEEQSSLQLTGKWAFIVNLPRYAVGLNLAPKATGTDGMLDLCSFREGSLLSGLTYLTGVLFGQHTRWEGCTMQQSSTFLLESDQRVPFQVDGDPGGFLPVEIGVIPARLRIYAPQTFLKRD
ncbi:MAG: diacylglycerol kinase family protein [Planctomycetota bacterium]|nr:diacylglycerol kinase family protein [Planctomycetota bacterium]